MMRVQHPRYINETSFSCLSVLGTGAYGKVMLVRKRGGPDHNHLFAMKVLLKDSIMQKAKMVEHVIWERTILEAIRPSKLFVNLHYAFQSQDRLHLVMDYVAGGELFTHLQKYHQLSEDHVRFYVAEMTLALAFLHHLKIIYRDLKLENVMLDRFGHIVLTDFGLSKIFPADDKVCRTHSFCGTIEYMAPEIIQVGPSGYSFTVDWWSLGVIAFELMGGKSPFYDGNQARRSHVDIANRITKGMLPKLTGATAPFRDLVEKLMRRTPSRRLGFKGASQITGHRFFKTIDWVKLEARRIPPPVVPILSSEMDTKYFLKEFTMQSVSDGDLHPPQKSSNMFLDYEFNVNETKPDECSALFECVRPRTGNIRKKSQKGYFSDRYELVDKCGYFGEGSNSVVRRCNQKKSSLEFAVKIIRKEIRGGVSTDDFVKLQGHPCIVNLIEVITDKTFTYIVMESLEGGELLPRVMSDGSFRMKHSRMIIMTLILALRFMHSYGVAHGNFRPEKVVLIDDGDIPNVKIVGLDSSTKPVNIPCVADANSSVNTVIPANSFRRMLETMDWWGMGIIMYALIYGSAPNLHEEIQGPHQGLSAEDVMQIFGHERELNRDFCKLTLGLLSVHWKLRANSWNDLIEGVWLEGKHMLYQVTLSPSKLKYSDIQSIKSSCDRYLGPDGTLVNAFIGNPDVAQRLRPASSQFEHSANSRQFAYRKYGKREPCDLQDILEHPVDNCKLSVRKTQGAGARKPGTSNQRKCKLTKCSDSRMKTPTKSTHHMKLRSNKCCSQRADLQ